MAKGLFGMGGGAPRTTNNGSPGGIRPMPRPVPGAEAGAGQPRQGPLASYLGPQGSETRADMAMEFLKAAMAAAPGSGSPALQFLAPLVGGMIGARTEKLRDDRKAAEVTAMTDSILGPNGLSPAAKRAAEVMNNENAPDYLRAIAKKQFDAAMAGQGGTAPRRSSGGGGGGAAAPAGGKPAGRPRVYGAPFEINGQLYQRDGFGNAVPMIDPNGQPVPAKGGGGTVPGGGPSADDPLGLRTTPMQDPLEMP